MRTSSVRIFNENFFRSLTGVSLNYTIVVDGKVEASGSNNHLDIQPQQRATITLDWLDKILANDAFKGKEILLNLEFKLEQHHHRPSAVYRRSLHLPNG